jgi:exodeoxyribonuclease VII small subunit
MSDLFEEPSERTGGVESTSSESAEGPSFELSLRQLENAVEKLEAGDLALSDALRLFEEGLKASNLCRARLEEAKQKVELLLSKSDGEFRLREIDPGDDL